MTKVHKKADHSSYPQSIAPPPTQLPLSRTCQTCTKAKVKCSRGDESLVCDRCRRLSKDCVFPQARRRNNGTRKDLRIEALEAKVNQLIGNGDVSNQKCTSTEPPPQNDPHETASPSTLMHSPTSDFPVPASNGNTAGAFRGALKADVIAAGLLTLETASSLLNTFRTNMTPRFPFVCIEPQQTAEGLRQQRPFLFLAILAAASYEDLPLQRVLGKEVKREISDRMILNGEVSFDLLQGLIVHLAWCQYHSRPRQHSQLLQLAVSIVVDLRLDQSPQARSWKTGVTFNADSPVDNSTQLSRSRDQQRAIAACFYLSSSTSILLQKYSTFPYSAYIEDCCESLGEQEEYPSDKYLLHIIRLQHILEKSNRLSVQNGVEPSYADTAVELYVTTLKSDLELFRGRLPFSINESNMLVIQFHTVELFLYQISLLDRSSESGQNATCPGSWSPWRLEILRSGLASAKLLLDSYLSLPLRAELTFNNSEWIQLGFALIVASKFSIAGTAQSISGETMSLRRSLDMSGTLKQSVHRTRTLISPHSDADGERDVFFHYEKRARALHCWFEKHLSEQPALSPHGKNQLGDSSFQVIAPDLQTQAVGDMPSSFTEFTGLDEGLPPEESYDPHMPNDFLEDTVDDMMGDWMSYPMFPFS